jgi:hypothetical protein
MRFGRFQWTIVFVIALLAPCGAAGPARADLMAGSAPPFIGQFQAFLQDFPHWDSTHQNTPLTFLATTPENQRPQSLVMLWLLWMRDHNLTPPATGTGGGAVASLPPDNPPPPPGGAPVGIPPPGGGTPPGGGHTSGSSPEPSSLVLMGCGSLGLFAYRLVRSRAARRR